MLLKIEKKKKCAKRKSTIIIWAKYKMMMLIVGSLHASDTKPMLSCISFACNLVAHLLNLYDDADEACKRRMEYAAAHKIIWYMDFLLLNLIISSSISFLSLSLPLHPFHTVSFCNTHISRRGFVTHSIWQIYINICKYGFGVEVAKKQQKELCEASKNRMYVERSTPCKCTYKYNSVHRGCCCCLFLFRVAIWCESRAILSRNHRLMCSFNSLYVLYFPQFILFFSSSPPLSLWRWCKDICINARFTMS